MRECAWIIIAEAMFYVVLFHYFQFLFLHCLQATLSSIDECLSESSIQESFHTFKTYRSFSFDCCLEAVFWVNLLITKSFFVFRKCQAYHFYFAIGVVMLYATDPSQKCLFTLIEVVVPKRIIENFFLWTNFVTSMLNFLRLNLIIKNSLHVVSTWV